MGGFRRVPQQCKLVVTVNPAILQHGTSTDAGMQYCTNRSADTGNSCTVLARADVWTDSSGASGPVTPHCAVPRVTGNAHHQHQGCGVPAVRQQQYNTVRTTGDLWRPISSLTKCYSSAHSPNALSHTHTRARTHTHTHTHTDTHCHTHSHTSATACNYADA